jgi:DNA polymerase elongation subunit (family B)
MKDKIIVKEHKRIKSEESYPGAYVFDPKLGISKWTASFDYASMYPTLIRELNMSYETIVESDCPFDDKVVYSDLSGNSYEGEVCRSVHSTFKGDKEGIFPKALKQLMNERKEWKKKMFAHSQNIKAIQDEIKRREGQND